MPPTDGQLMPAGQQGPVGTMSLATLIDYILQRTYHELSVLSELLPRKTDMERKIEIVQFANRTRQLFVRLLALVKWAVSASQVDTCASISQFLDKQAMLFVETADLLARTARETLVNSRLPCFSIHGAIDVLTTGTYPRLPVCIREKIVPPDLITPQEKWDTLLKLNKVIEHRLVTADLPSQFRKPKIENGRVKFLVEHEFEVTLTLMGDGPHVPWRLLDINIIVQDPETGDGSALVHSLQVQYIHQLIQTRIMASELPLQEIYNCLHSFCQSLQLEVLQSQAQRLLRERLGENIFIDCYIAGSCLEISYWRGQSRGQSSASTHYRVKVHVDDTNTTKPLQISHSPTLHGAPPSESVPQTIKNDHLSLEKLLVQTIQVRSLLKLKELEIVLKSYAINQITKSQQIPPVLQVPIVEPCLDAEKLHVSIDTQTGCHLVSLPFYSGKCSLATDLENYLNEIAHVKPNAILAKMISSLRLWLAIRQCTKRVQHLPVSVSEYIPLIHVTGHPIEKLSPCKVYIKLCRQPRFYLVVEIKENQSNILEYEYWMLKVEPSVFESPEGEIVEKDLPMPYLTPGYMVRLDGYSATHGPHTKIEKDFEEVFDVVSQQNKKRKLLLGYTSDHETKRSKTKPDHLSVLGHVLVMCDERIPFIGLADELQKQGFAHQGVAVEAGGVCLGITLLSFPPVMGCSMDATASIEKHLLSCSLRLQSKSLVRNWVAEFVFINCSLVGTQDKGQGPLRRVYFTYELNQSEGIQKTVEQLGMCWTSMTHIHAAALEFNEIYQDVKSGLSNVVEVKSYTYKKILLAYGTNNSYLVSIKWKPEANQFHLHFMTSGGASRANPHTLVLQFLTAELNEHKSVARLAQVLHETFSPLCAISKLNTTPCLGLSSKSNQAIAIFTILPQSSTHIRLMYRNMNCLDLHCRGNHFVSVRDGAFSLFDTSKVVEGTSPTQNLRAFLSMFVDDTTSNVFNRRRSTAEDDNPPSPFGIDMDAFLSQQPSTGSPSSIRKQDSAGLKFLQSPMTPPSNPHTPSSPRMSQQGYSNSPAAAFPLASPPSMMATASPGNIFTPNSPGSANLPVTSPGSFVPAPSPGSLGVYASSSPFISPQGLVEGGSPYPNLVTPSPGTRNWPGSPSVSGPSPASRHGAATSPIKGDGDHIARPSLLSPPSRTLPQRSWAASVPTVISHEALHKLLSPSALPGINPSYPLTCPLERFLGCIYMKRNLHRVIASRDETKLQSVQTTEAGTVVFKTDNLQFKVTLNSTNLQTLLVKINPTMEYMDRWSTEELQTLEKYFETKVLCPPYKANPVIAFCKLLSAPFSVLKDCVQIIRYEMFPDRTMKWNLQLCLTVPVGGPSISPLGNSAVVVPTTAGKSNKVLIMIHLSKFGSTNQGGTQSVIVPILYDISNNTTTLLEDRKAAQSTNANPAISALLRRYAECNPTYTECTILPAIRELLTNLVVPS